MTEEPSETIALFLYPRRPHGRAIPSPNRMNVRVEAEVKRPRRHARKLSTIIARILFLENLYTAGR